MFRKFLLNIPFLFLASCTVYQSGGRKVLEDNTNNVVYGLSLDLRFYYECSTSPHLPEFLKEPLDAVETPYESINFTTLLKREPPGWLAVHRQNASSQLHEQCKIYFLKDQRFSHRETLRAAQLGVQKIKSLCAKQ